MSARNLAAQAATVLCLLAHGVCAQAQAPANFFNYSRTSSFTYYGGADGAKNGLLKTETVEPELAESCVVSTHSYDVWGNKGATSTANCTNPAPTADAVFEARSASQAWTLASLPSVTVGGNTFVLQAGQYPLEATNALSHKVSQRFDPRFGLPIEIVDANGIKVTLEYDDLGRKTKEKRFNDNATFSQGSMWRYCVLPGKGVSTSINSWGCPSSVPPGAPDDAVQLVQTWPVGNSDGKTGPMSTVYTDRAGRAIRSLSESFDGAEQPAAVSGQDLAQDTVYNAYGAVVLKTQPYWLDTGASTTGGANSVGVTKIVLDALGRAQTVFVVDSKGSRTNITFGAGTFAGYGAYGARNAAVTEYVYAGLRTTVTDDVDRVRVEEKNPLGEVVRTTDPTGAQIVMQREAFGALRYTKDPLGNIVWVNSTIRGFKAAITDPDAGYSSFGYNALGELKWQRNPKQAAKPTPTKTQLAYDKLGRLTQRIDDEYTSTWYRDLDAGGVACGKGRLCEVRTDHDIRKRYWYDRFGRPTSERTDIGPIGAPTRSWAQARSWSDTSGRLLTSTWPTGVKIGYDYTALGFVSQIKLLTSATVHPLPGTAGGTPGSDMAWGADKVLWHPEAINAWGQSERAGTGAPTEPTNVITTTAYEGPTGRLLNRKAGLDAGSGLFSQTYTWDSQNRLVHRTDPNGDGTRDADDNLKGLDEDFGYDKLDRLIRYSADHIDIPTSHRGVLLTYNALGMLLKRSDTGAYTYAAVVAGQTTPKPHALRTFTPNSGAATTYGYDANGNLISASAGKYSAITYTSFNQPDANNGLQGPAGGPQYTWQYDDNQARIKEIQTIASGAMAGTRTTWRAHPDNAGALSFEHEDNAPTVPSAGNPDVDQSRHYLSVGGQTVAVLVTEGPLPTLGASAKAPTSITTVVLRKVEYWHTDHLGSVISTSNHLGYITARASYDPFGQRRAPTGEADPTQSIEIDWDPALNRRTGNGFTGHEHLDDVGIVHMNGRIYDPRLGVFLQPDPLIQSPNNLQNYNRYGYCYNGPLNCSDPTGYFSLRKFLGGAILSVLVPPWGTYIVAREVANSQVGYQIGSIVITIGSFYCGPSAPLCNAGGQAAWAGFSGASAESAVKVGARAGLSTYANQLIGGIDNPGWNVTAHAAWGCAEGKLAGGSCGAGARGAFVSSLIGDGGTIGDPQANFGDLVASVAVHAAAGGLASMAGGGNFAQGAQSAAYAYLFNYLAHVHRAFTEQGANGVLGAAEGRALGQLVVDADVGTQGLQDANRHGMCVAGQASGACSLAVQGFINDEYSKGTVVGLANAIHALQDLNALGHRLGSYDGMGRLVFSIDAIPHLLGDFLPSSSERLWVPVMTQKMIQSWTAANPSAFRQYMRDLTH